LAEILTYDGYPTWQATAFDLGNLSAEYLREAFWAALDQGLVTRYEANDARPTLNGLAATCEQAFLTWANTCEQAGDAYHADYWRLQAALLYQWVGASSAAYQDWQALAIDGRDPLLQPYYDYWDCFLHTVKTVTDGERSRMEADSALATCPDLSSLDLDSLANLRRGRDPVHQGISWQVFPNPVQDRLVVQIDLPEPRPTQLILVNSLGQVIAKQNLATLPAGTHHHKWTLATLPAGMYLLRLQAGDFQAVRRIRVN
jgi:hypothetical protein